MVINVMNRRIMIGRKQMLSCFGLVVSWLTLASSGFGTGSSLALLGVIYVVLRFGTQPFSRFIARLGYSIRWKFEIAIGAITGLFLVVGLIQIGAMNFMHGELHNIQDAEPEHHLKYSVPWICWKAPNMVFYTACCHFWLCLGCWAPPPLAQQ